MGAFTFQAAGGPHAAGPASGGCRCRGKMMSPFCCPGLYLLSGAIVRSREAPRVWPGVVPTEGCAQVSQGSSGLSNMQSMVSELKFTGFNVSRSPGWRGLISGRRRLDAALGGLRKFTIPAKLD